MTVALGARSSLRQVLAFLRLGDLGELVACFAPGAHLHDPVAGSRIGEAAILDALEACRGWLADREVEAEHEAMSLAGGRLAREARLRLIEPTRRRRLGLAAVFEVDAAGRITELRLYYDAREVPGAPRLRKPFLAPDPALVLPYPLATLSHRAGGLRFRPCLLTDDGCRGTLEYVADHCGHAPIRPQAGALVFERDGAGTLASVRRYDSIARPFA